MFINFLYYHKKNPSVSTLFNSDPHYTKELSNREAYEHYGTPLM